MPGAGIQANLQNQAPPLPCHFHADGPLLTSGHAAYHTPLGQVSVSGAAHARVVKHATSGDLRGDYTSVVGYGAAVIWKADE